MSALTPEALRARQLRSQRAFYEALGGGAEGSRTVAVAPAVQATIVPVRRWFSIFNAVVYDEGAPLAETLPAIHQLYTDSGIGAWSVWTRPDDSGTVDQLIASGYTQEGAALVMGAALRDLDVAPRRELELVAEPTWKDVARCNDRAHGVLPEYSMHAAFGEMRDPDSRLYAVRHRGEIVSGLIARRSQGGDCYFWFVATVPEAQGEGVGGELMRLALREALADGCVTATLESTGAGERLYRQLGFVALGHTPRLARYAA